MTSQLLPLAMIALSLALVSSPHAQASEFNFRFEFGCGPPDTVDTLNHTFTRRGGDGSQLATIPLTLSDQQMRVIADALEQLRFFDYPERFSGVDRNAKELITTSPSNKYRLEVHIDGRSHAVEWDDGHGPYSPEAVSLNRVFQTIKGYLSERPDVRRLPSRNPCY
jgi:hypothetical protein